MGLFKKPKDMTHEESIAYLQKHGHRVDQSKGREKKFGAFTSYAKDVNKSTAQNYEPTTSTSSNPYAGANVSYGAPSGGSNSQSSASSNPYAAMSTSYGNNSYGSNTSAPPASHGYGQQQSSSAYRQGGSSGGGIANRYGYSSDANPYASVGESYGYKSNQDEEEVSEMKKELFKGNTLNKPKAEATLSNDQDSDDERDTYSGTTYAGEEEHQQLNESDEEYEGIRRQTKEVRGATTDSTRRTLQMAAEAEAAGRNALGMLGAQGESLADTEHSLAISENLQRTAEQKTKELKGLNRSIFLPNVSNPFMSKQRELDRQRKVKTQYELEKMERENRRKVEYDSQQRIMNSLKNKPSETAEKYKPRTDSDRKKYLGEDYDSEDEAMENEIDSNLDQIGAAAKRLRDLAMTTQTELDSQEKRLESISQKTDKVDTHTVMNTYRLNNIK